MWKYIKARSLAHPTLRFYASQAQHTRLPQLKLLTSCCVSAGWQACWKTSSKETLAALDPAVLPAFPTLALPQILLGFIRRGSSHNRHHVRFHNVMLGTLPADHNPSPTIQSQGKVTGPRHANRDHAAAHDFPLRFLPGKQASRTWIKTSIRNVCQSQRDNS